VVWLSSCLELLDSGLFASWPPKKVSLVRTRRAQWVCVDGVWFESRVVELLAALLAAAVLSLIARGQVWSRNGHFVRGEV